jgi:hypothetical protein
MNHTEQEIIEKAEAVTKDLFGHSYRSGQVVKAMYNPNEEPLRGEGTSIAAWTALINEPVIDSFIFLTISDDTGEPLYTRSKHLVREITTDGNGKYIRIE